uniref:Uncharacterized protein n=1 Tax=Anguilla anguilla TaxID=7936 RepID=A0A0E9QT09_ANGAN
MNCIIAFRCQVSTPDTFIVTNYASAFY